MIIVYEKTILSLSDHFIHVYKCVFVVIYFSICFYILFQIKILIKKLVKFINQRERGNSSTTNRIECLIG